MARRNHNRRDDIDITREELDQITEAMKKEEFRKLFVDYIEEINDPENKALYEKELSQYEKERGVDITFIHPEPGYVIKTSVDGSKKAFINICQNDKIEKPTAVRAVQGGDSGMTWSLPYIQAPPRDDLDKDKKYCVVYDVVFHPSTLELAKNDPRIKNFVNDTALDAVERSFEVKLDRTNLKFPKMGFKGYKHSCVIRKKSVDFPGPLESNIEDIIPNPHYPYCEPKSEPAVYTSTQKEKQEYNTPTYLIKHRKNLEFEEFTCSSNAKMNSCVAHELLIEINLPLIKSTSDVELLLSEKSLSLKSESPAKYKLDLKLPFYILDNESSAKFDASSRKLLVTAVVDRRKHCLSKEDSGLESDPSRGLSSSSDEDISKLDKLNSVESSTSDLNNEAEKGDSSDKEDYFSVDSHEDMDMDIFEPFLNLDTHYSFPTYSISKILNRIKVDFSVKNVEPSSLFHIFSENNSQFQIKFYCMGSGFVPINYTACLKVVSCSFDPLSFKTVVSDESVSINLSFSKGEFYSPIHVGRDPSDLREVQVEDAEITLKLSKLKLCSTADNDSDDCDDDEKLECSSTEFVETKKLNDGPTAKSNTSATKKNEKKIRRTHSESACSIPQVQRRSILKDTRSLSESNANDYAGFSVSLDSEDGSGSHENGHIKKQVRFSETISKKIFRANSCILGTRRKNQRKARNKRKAEERRNSENAASQSESEVSEFSEVSDYSEVSDISETSESDDGSTNGPAVPPTPCSKSTHTRKGKKNHRKAANTAKINCLFDNDA